MYWDTIISECLEFCYVAISTVKRCKERIKRYCWICDKENTKTLILQQCMGYSICCYCSKECQNMYQEE